MTAEAIQLVIVTPGRKLLSERIAEVVLPGADGELGILPEHAPLITELGIGELRYRAAGSTKFESIVLIRGFAEVLQDRVTLLAEIAEKPEEINVERAKAALARAEKRIASGMSGEEMDWERATAALERALIRLKVAAYAPRLHGTPVSA